MKAEIYLYQDYVHTQTVGWQWLRIYIYGYYMQTKVWEGKHITNITQGVISISYFWHKQIYIGKITRRTTGARGCYFQTSVYQVI